MIWNKIWKNIIYEIYYINGKFHREDGIAYQEWYENGDKISYYFYLNGVRYNKERCIEKLKEINSPHYEEQKMLYESEKYNL